MKLSKYHLARWSVLIRERDEMVCFMCERRCLKRKEIRTAHSTRKHRTSTQGYFLHVPGHGWISEDDVNGLLGEAHHIKVKVVHPEFAYDLDNGVTLCWRCHRDVVHSTRLLWKVYRSIFVRAMRRVANRKFNEKNQGRV